MSWEIDHVFVCTSVGAAEADRLVTLGLTEGKPNRHPGQGTACRRFVFTNAYLELLWVEDAEQARGEVARPLRLWERWSGRAPGACPFGICLRPVEQQGQPPFTTWEYRPPYLPPPLVIHMGQNSESIGEPLLFHASFGRQTYTSPRRALFRALTAMRILGPNAAAPSVEMQAAVQTGALIYREGPEHLMEIGFDEERQGRREDLRPALPLVLCW
jgi:hypothetical protein